MTICIIDQLLSQVKLAEMRRPTVRFLVTDTRVRICLTWSRMPALRGFWIVEKGKEKELRTSSVTLGIDSSMLVIECRKIIIAAASKIEE